MNHLTKKFDHKTVVLKFWHQVVPNTEGQAVGAANVAFLD
jgi:hypothetical protein